MGNGDIKLERLEGKINAFSDKWKMLPNLITIGMSLSLIMNGNFLLYYYMELWELKVCN